MKKVLMTLATTALMVTAFAQKASPKEITCAVMKGDKVNIAKATKAKLFSDYKGKRYYFCCAACKPTFDKSPEKYKNSPSVPAPKPTPAKKKKG